MRIGVFDSGLGGLTILNAIRERLPLYDYVYYGDTKNLPYGDKSEEEILALTKYAVRALFKMDVALVIVACNTASAETLRELQDTILVGEFRDRRIIGVIIPTIETLIDVDSKHALLIGTRRTVESKKYERELLKRSSGVNLISLATPELVPLIESNDIDGAFTLLKNHLAPQVGEIDTLVLGCTHYTVLKDRIRRGYPLLRVLSQDEIIPEKLEAYLEAHPEIEAHLTRGKTCEHIVTGKHEEVLEDRRE